MGSTQGGMQSGLAEEIGSCSGARRHSRGEYPSLSVGASHVASLRTPHRGFHSLGEQAYVFRRRDRCEGSRGRQG